LLTGFGNDMLKIGFIKILADGSLGGQTAALKKPYADKTQTKGVMLYTRKRLDKLVLQAHMAGQQLAIHAIGDRAVDIVLKAFEKAQKQFPRENYRHRIEHCSLLNQKLIKRIKKAELIASVQPHFVVSDFWITDRVGKKRARWVYPFKSLVREEIIVVSGSDSPVEPISPLLGLWAATSRSSFPEEDLTLEEALRTYAINAAYASFDEKIRGTIEVGKLADFTIISGDLTRMKPSNPPNLKVEMTIVNGKAVYTRHQR
jgi:predicted amidohydrolase YtcJ